jgi:hypothetical protein
MTTIRWTQLVPLVPDPDTDVDALAAATLRALQGPEAPLTAPEDPGTPVVDPEFGPRQVLSDQDYWTIVTHSVRQRPQAYGYAGVVWIRRGWERYEGPEPVPGPWCPQCRTVYGGDPGDGDRSAEALLETWCATHVEPVLSCHGRGVDGSPCGHSAPWGDWDIEGGSVVGPLSVGVAPETGRPPGVHSDDLGDQIGETLREATGLRWAYVRGEI